MKAPKSLCTAGFSALALGLSLMAFSAVPAQAQETRFYLPGLPGGSFGVDIASMLDRKYFTVVRQAYDFSCGSAALATLLNYHYGIAADETLTFTGMWTEGDQDAIRVAGFSLLDMKRFLHSIDLEAEGYRVDLDQIQKTGVPGIALTVTKGYRHFVVVKGVKENSVLVGDPSRGLLKYSREEFAEVWDGLYFVITTSQEKGRQSFNRPPQWAAVPSAPVNGRYIRPIDPERTRTTLPALVLGEL